MRVINNIDPGHPEIGNDHDSLSPDILMRLEPKNRFELYNDR